MVVTLKLVYYYFYHYTQNHMICTIFLSYTVVTLEFVYSVYWKEGVKQEVNLEYGTGFTNRD